MHIKSIRIDGFGPWHDLRIEGLSDGLNVFFGPPGSGKSLLRRFVRAILTGFGDGAAAAPWSLEQPVIGGTLLTLGPAGRVEISRYHDGTRQGRLIARGPDAQRQDQALLSAVRQLPASTFECLLDADFHGRPSLNRLLETIHGSGMLSDHPAARHDREEAQRELAALEADLRELEQRLETSQLIRRRGELLREIERLADQLERLQRQRGGTDHERRALQDEAERQEIEIRRLRQLRDRLDQEAEGLRQQAARLRSYTPPRPAPRQPVPARPAPVAGLPVSSDSEVHTLVRQLEAIDEQVRRWRRVQRDVESRRDALRAELTQWEMNRAANGSSASPRRRMALLEQQLNRLQDQIARLEANSQRECVCEATLRQAAPVLQDLRQQLYGLCQDLTSQQRLLRREAALNELKQLRRCRLELVAHIRRLVERRQTLLRQYGQLDAAGLERYRRAEGGQCDCSAHDEFLREATRGSSARSTKAERTADHAFVEAPLTARPPDRVPDEHLEQLEQLEHLEQLERLQQVERQIAQLNERRKQLQADLDAVQAAHRRTRSRLNSLSPAPATDEISEALATCRQQLQAVEQQLERTERDREELRRKIQRLEHILATREEHPRETPELLETAASYLRRLTSGKYVQVGGPGADGLLWITSHDKQTYPHDVLGPQTYDQLFLSLRLAVATVLARRGVHMPLILDDPFLHIDVEQHAEVLQVLSRFAEGGHQVLLLTSNPAAARLLSEQDHWVRDLPELPPQTPRGAMAPELTPFVARSQSPSADDQIEGQTDVLAENRQAAPRHESQPHEPRTTYPAAGVSQPRIVERPWNGSHRHQPPRRAVPHVGGMSGNGQPGGSSPYHSQAPWTFYLETSSPIEDAPSIGRKMAAQLRSIGVTQVSDLLALSPKVAAAQLAHLTVPSDTIRAWQAQAWLVCCVPHLRSYDARILVACGITDPDQLEKMDPQELLQRVERFLATREGERIVQSGNDYELARISSWIRMARQASRKRQREAERRRAEERAGGSDASGRRVSRRPWTAPDPEASDDATGWDETLVLEDDSDTGPRLWESDHHPRLAQSKWRYTSGSPSPASGNSASTSASSPVGPENSLSNPTSSLGRATNSRGEDAQVARRHSNGSARANRSTANRSPASSPPHRDAERHQFHLHRTSPVVDAPSIGPRMAERLEEIGIISVLDLLAADPHDLAHQLDHPRVKASTVRAWQAQARLVCRVPHLRGHDAQLLVACGFTEPEQLRTMSADALYATIAPLAASRKGQRILRSGKQPDLEEVADWIRWAHHTRPLKAA